MEKQTSLPFFFSKDNTFQILSFFLLFHEGVVSSSLDSAFDILENLIDNKLLDAALSVVRLYRHLESNVLQEQIPMEWTFISEFVENFLAEFQKPNPWLDPISM